MLAKISLLATLLLALSPLQAQADEIAMYKSKLSSVPILHLHPVHQSGGQCNMRSIRVILGLGLSGVLLYLTDTVPSQLL